MVRPTPSRRILRAALRLGLATAAVGMAPPVAIYFAANGVTLGALAFAGLPVALLLLAVNRPRVAGAVVVAQLGFVGWRVAVVPRAVEGWRFCEGTVCGRGPWWSYLAPEREAVLAGLELSRAAGVVGGVEYRSFRAAFDAAYPREEGLPNPLLVFSRAGAVHTLVHLPPGKARAPGIVFLHGFGGLLTAYLRTMAASPLGARYVLVAPALDPVGDWGSARGQAVVNQVLAELPPEVDRRRVFLVGLSNGSIYGARYAPRFAGAVLLSGVGDTSGGRLLVLSGEDDVRVPIEYVRAEVARLKAAGIAVELRELSGDHGLILSAGPEWTALAAAWLETINAPGRTASPK